jgi:hypothetical protein
VGQVNAKGEDEEQVVEEHTTRRTDGVTSVKLQLTTQRSVISRPSPATNITAIPQRMILVITVEGPDTNLWHAQSGKEVRPHVNRLNTPEQHLVVQTSLPWMVRPATAPGTDYPT